MDSHSKSLKQPGLGDEQSAPDIEADEDDESNINSDEQDEYLECVPGQGHYQNFASNDPLADDSLVQHRPYSKHSQQQVSLVKKHS